MSKRTAKVSFWRSWFVSRRISLATHSPLGRRLPQPRRDVHVLVVEEDPRLGPLGGRLSHVRRQLNETRDRRNRPVDRLVEHTVELDTLVQPDRADRHPALLVTVHHGGRSRSIGAVDETRVECAGSLLLAGRRPRDGGESPRGAPRRRRTSAARSPSRASAVRRLGPAFRRPAPSDDAGTGRGRVEGGRAALKPERPRAGSPAGPTRSTTVFRHDPHPRAGVSRGRGGQGQDLHYLMVPCTERVSTCGQALLAVRRGSARRPHGPAAGMVAWSALPFNHPFERCGRPEYRREDPAWDPSRLRSHPRPSSGRRPGRDPRPGGDTASGPAGAGSPTRARPAGRHRRRQRVPEHPRPVGRTPSGAGRDVRRAPRRGAGRSPGAGELQLDGAARNDVG